MVRRIKKANTPMTMPTIAPADKEEDELAEVEPLFIAAVVCCAALDSQRHVTTNAPRYRSNLVSTIIHDNVLREGDIVVKTLVLSVDPHMHGRIRDQAQKSHQPPFELGKPLDGYGVFNYKTPHANTHARIVACGAMSFYIKPESVDNLAFIISKRVQISDFMAFDYEGDEAECMQKMTRMIKQGKITYKEDVSEGIESLPDALVGLFDGRNFRKAVVEVAKQ